jgi:hypothetical protein
MGWEIRGGKRYYYRKRWAAGRVVSEYVGHGPVVELVAQYEALEKQQRRGQAALERDTLQALLDQIQEPEALRAYAVAVAAAVKEVLTRLGFHQLKRTWRLQRMGNLTVVDDRAQDIARARTLFLKKQMTPEELAEYKRLLNTHPSLPRMYGDAPALARLHLMEIFKSPRTDAAVEARIA